jgi:hypothetical protein
MIDGHGTLAQLCSFVVSVLEQPFCTDLVVPAGSRGYVPSHCISQSIVDIEQERDFQRVADRAFRHARSHDDADVLGAQTSMIKCHRLEQPKRGSELVVNRRRGVVVQHLLCQAFAFQGRRRDRGVCVRSKVALIQA